MKSSILAIALLLKLANIQAQVQYISGGCTLVGSSLYMFGGQVIDTDDKVKTNQGIYMLELNESTNLNKPQTLNPKKIEKGAGYEAIGAKVIKESSNSTNLFVLGGEGIALDASFLKFDTKNSKLSLFSKAIKEFPATVFSEDHLGKSQSISKFSFHQNDIKPNEYIIMGGQYLNNEEKAVYLKSPLIFDLKKMDWKVGKGEFSRVNAASGFLKGKMYILGGYDADQPKGYSLDTVTVYDVAAQKISSVKIKGSKPPLVKVLNSIQVENLIYITGETQVDKSRSENNILYIYDISKNTFRSVTIPGYSALSNACLVHVNNTLIEAFGKPTDNRSNTFNFINLDDNKMVTSLSSNTETVKPDSKGLVNLEYTTIYFQNSKESFLKLSTQAIIGITVASLLALYFLISLLVILLSSPKTALGNDVKDPSIENEAKILKEGEEMNDYLQWLENSKNKKESFMLTTLPTGAGPSHSR